MLKKALLWAAALTAPVICSATQVRLIWPPEGHHYWALRSSFVFGSVQPASSRLTINGQAVPVYRTGAFLAMVPLTLGEFPIDVKAVSEEGRAELVRRVVVDPPAPPSPRTAVELDPAYYSPREDVAFKAGDRLRVICKGPPGARVRFRIGEGRSRPMAEVEPEPPSTPPGVYKGDYLIPAGVRFDRAPIRFRLVTEGGRILAGRAPGALSIDDGTEERVCRMKDDLVTVLSGPDKDLGYEAFLPKGVVAGVTGSWGKYLRLGFGDRTLGWVESEGVTLLPEGTPEPHSVLGSLTVKTTADSDLISLPLSEAQPFRVEETLNPVRFKLFLYGVTADMDKVDYQTGGSVVKNIRWTQVNEDLCEVDIATSLRDGWGYDVRYEEGRMMFEIRRAPPLKATWTRPLGGLVVALDAGHSSGDPGATGPLGTREDAINLLVARRLKAKLESLGASVVMVRRDDETLDLLKRTRIAWAARAHLFVSLHENSIADSGNPLEDSGFSIHYRVPQSRALAEAVQDAYRELIPLRDRGLWSDNLAVCRMTQMPAILTESAFLIVPEQEALLLDPAFRDRIAAAVAQGIQQFLKKTDVLK